VLGDSSAVFSALQGCRPLEGGRCRRASAASHGTKVAQRDTLLIDVACQLIEVPVKAPGDRPTVLTDGALQMTGYHDASGVSSIGCPVLLSTGTDRRWFQAYALTPANRPTGMRYSERVNIHVVASSPCHVRASKTHRTPLLAPELTARTGLSLAQAGAEVGCHGSHLAHEG
jgi:hypothetical protein